MIAVNTNILFKKIFIEIRCNNTWSENSKLNMKNKSWKKMQFAGASQLVRVFQSILGYIFGSMFSTRYCPVCLFLAWAIGLVRITRYNWDTRFEIHRKACTALPALYPYQLTQNTSLAHINMVFWLKNSSICKNLRSFILLENCYQW